MLLINIFENQNDNVITVYRGESVYNRNGNFWTQSIEFAKQFTQSGKISEVKIRYMNKNDIYMNSVKIYAGNETGVDNALETAKSLGFKAIMLNEGNGEPNSIFVFDKTALRFSK